MSIISKLLKWLPLNLMSILGVVQAFIKLLKEILTAIVNILFPIIPSAKFKAIVTKVRDIVNKIDEIVENIKGFLGKRIGL